MVADNGLLISFEGISGTGKTHLSKALQETTRELRVTFVNELSERSGGGMDRKIIGLLHSAGDRFCRVGLPLSETFLLLALKMVDFEVHIAAALANNATVVEDRSIDTVAVYQAMILAPDDPSKWLSLAAQIYVTASQWRRAPDLTFLLDDDFEVCIARAERRNNSRYSGNERDLLRNAASLYKRYALQHPGRIISIDRRRMSEADILATIRAEIQSKQAGRVS